MKKNNTFVTTNEDAAKDEILNYQQATTDIKKTLAQYVGLGLSKEQVEAKIKEVLKKFKNGSKLDKLTLQKYLKDLTTFAQTQYYVLDQNFKKVNQRYCKSFGIDPRALLGSNLSAIVSEEKFRGFVTNNDKGNALIKNYQKIVRSELKRLATEQPSGLGSNGKQMATRNQIECKVRHEVNMKELEEYRQDVPNHLVYISSHVDCSLRCQKWQGKLYSLNGTSGTIDGISYEPIENALNDNTFGDGNSIINGYNCRHYLIPYEKGMKAPADYNVAEIKKQRAIDQKQRQYENSIRNLKMQEQVIREAGNLDEANKLRDKWKNTEKNYQTFSVKNGRAFYTWRTQVMEDEYNKYNSL